jgi:hypothetical protein
MQRINSLFAPKNSLLREKNSLFHCVGNFSWKPLNLLTD